jgi:hypothetical protein
MNKMPPMVTTNATIPVREENQMRCMASGSSHRPSLNNERNTHAANPFIAMKANVTTRKPVKCDTSELYPSAPRETNRGAILVNALLPPPRQRALVRPSVLDAKASGPNAKHEVKLNHGQHLN